MKKIIITIIGLGLALNAEEIVSLDGYMLGATGKNINIRYYTESVDELYFKYGIGQESLDVLYGNVEYDYNMIGLGYSMFELYYKLPMNESVSEKYISDSVDGYMGLDFNMEFRSADFTFGFNLGIFNPPKLKYKEYSWVDETDITGFKMGINIGYTFGDVDEEKLAKRNAQIGHALQSYGQARSQSNIKIPRYNSSVNLGSSSNTNSLSNPYGAGSKYKTDGLLNPYSEFGSKYSNKSWNNPYATDAPKLYNERGEYRGKLGGNKYDPDSTSNPYGRYGSKYSPDSINNPYGAGNPYSSETIYVVPSK